MLEGLKVAEHCRVRDLVAGSLEVLLIGVALDELEELDIPELLKLGRVDHLDVLEGERYLLLLPHALPLLLQGYNFPMFKLPLQVFLLDALFDLLALAHFGVLVVEDDRCIGLVADQIVLELILVVPRDDLLVDDLGELRLVLLPALQALLQIVVFALLAADGVVLDELQRVF